MKPVMLYVMGFLVNLNQPLVYMMGYGHKKHVNIHITLPSSLLTMHFAQSPWPFYAFILLTCD